MIPASIPALTSHVSTATFTQTGTGTVRTCPPLSEQVDDRPVVVSLLKMAYSEPSEF
jgi:hypothetical protein